MTTTTDRRTNPTTPAPKCPEWCARHTFASLDETPAWHHHHQTSPEGAPFVVEVSQVEGEPAGVYVQDSRGDDLTPAQARAFADALTTAAGLLGFWGTTTAALAESVEQ